MKNPLWKIKKEKLDKTNLFRYSKFVKEHYKFDAENDYNKLWEWSVRNIPLFWKSVWDFTKVKGNQGKILIKKSNSFHKNKFFPEAKLNYAENIIKKKTLLYQLYLIVKMDLELLLLGVN